MCYVRNYSRSKRLLGDPTALKGWPEVFGSSDKATVEEELRRTGMDFSWGEGDSLRITNHEAAIEPHPITGEKVWHNQSQVCSLEALRCVCVCVCVCVTW